MALLEFVHVTKIFRRTRGGFYYRAGRGSRETIRAVNDFQLTIETGQSVGIVGESGSGKTTVAELAAGLQIPTSGTVRVNSQAIADHPEKSFRQRAAIVQFIWQDAAGSLDPRMTIMQSVAEPLKIHGSIERRGRSRRVMELLNEVGLDQEIAGRVPRELSGGEAQRVVIARALAQNPQLLVCDELASALDARIKNKIVELLENLRHRRQLALLVIAHDLPLVRRLVDDLVVMKGGAIVESGKTKEIFRRPAHPYTKLLWQSEPVLVRQKSVKVPALTDH